MSTPSQQQHDEFSHHMFTMMQAALNPELKVPVPIRCKPQPDSNAKRIWNKEQIRKLYEACKAYSVATGKSLDALKPMDFEYISLSFPQTTSQCIMKFQEIIKTGTMKSGAWSPEEDELLRTLVEEGKLKWIKIAKHINSNIYSGVRVRNGKKCRERWVNHLDHSVNKGPWTLQEDLHILEGFQKFGRKWTKISHGLNNRTDNYIKNRFVSLTNREKQKFRPDCTDDLVTEAIKNIKSQF